MPRAPSRADEPRHDVRAEVGCPGARELEPGEPRRRRRIAPAANPERSAEGAAVGKVAVMQHEVRATLVGILVQVLEPRRIERG